MRYLIVILASLILMGCAKYNATNEFFKKPNSKAFVEAFGGGYGFSSGQITPELAIMGAFYECEKSNPLILCELERINNDTVSSVEEKNKWKNVYIILFSLFFYYKSSGPFLGLFILMIISDYLFAKYIANQEGLKKNYCYIFHLYTAFHFYYILNILTLLFLT